MIDAAVRQQAPLADDATVPRRPLRSRLSMAHLVMVAAGLLAFVLILVALRDRSERSFVAMAANDIEHGTRLKASDVDFRAIDVADIEFFDRLLDPVEMQAALDSGAVAARSITGGQILVVADLRAASAAGGLRTMSLELDAAAAVGGALEPGDVIDVVAVIGSDRRTDVVAAGVTVVAAHGTGGGIGSSGVVLSLAVDADTALRLARAVSGDDVYVIRATGAPPIEVDSWTAGDA